MSRKVDPKNLTGAISGILKEYAAEETITLKEAVTKVSKAGVKQLRSVSRKVFNGTGTYAKGWATVVETGDTTAQGTIYNKDVPGQPHLLENPHAKRGGGRTTGTPHIAPVESQIVENFEKELMDTL